jgi:transposase
MRDIAESAADREQVMLEAVRQYFVRADSGRSDVLDLFTDDVQIYFPKFGLARGKACFGDLVPHRGWRNVKVTDRRAAVDYAQCMRELVDVHYPDAACIRVVQDNLSIHKPGALYEAFAPAEARRILRRLEFHFTPKHASWLNMVECEISVLQRQCLGRRIDDPKRLRNEIAAWQRRRNKTRASIKWMFTTDKARAKLGRAYPATAKESKSL